MSATPKRQRRRLARADLIVELSMTADRWACEVDSTEPKMRPFDEWPDDDPLRTLCRVYGLAPADLAGILRDLSADLEARAERCGYIESWTV